MKGRLLIAAGLLAAGAWGNAAVGTAPVPGLSSSGASRFEIAATDAGAATRVRSEAESAWNFLAGPLGLPERFSTPIFVRVVPAELWSEAAPFRVFAEPGGVVSLRLRWSDATPRFFLRRALVQSLLIRLAVADYGVGPRLTAPLWLEQACVGWWLTREQPAMLDALQQESAGLAPPRLADVLRWERSDVEPRRREIGAVWLLAWLQRESGTGRSWPEFRRRLLGGDEPSAALAACFPARFGDAADRELWWQVGWHSVRRVRSLPMWGIVESRNALTDLARLVLAVGGEDAVLPLRFALRRRDEPAVAAAMATRAAELDRMLPVLHPFYRNVGLALADCFARGKGGPADADKLAAEFERELADGLDLETTSRRMLDAFEASRRAETGAGR